MTHTKHFRIVAILAAAFILTGCATTTHTATSTPVVAPAVAPVVEPDTPAPVRLAVAGDSITSWDPPYLRNPGQSWVTTTASETLPVVAGWAYPGATIAQIEKNLQPAAVDVFVMMVGTNDLPIKLVHKKGTPAAQRLAAMDRMAGTVRAHHTIVAAVPPFGYGYADGQKWNAQLRAYAAQRGFSFIDPWASVRTTKGSWKNGTARTDNVHPTPKTAAIAGGVMRDFIVAISTPQPDRPLR